MDIVTWLNGMEGFKTQMIFVVGRKGESMGDLIWREDVLDTLLIGKEYLTRALDDTDVVCQDREKYSLVLRVIGACIDNIEELTPAEPRKKGKWKWCGNHHLCSECDEWALTRWDEDECDEVDILTDFCPSCGADMRGDSK